ncbi:MAG: cupin domain-containing protein [Kofleriaceae bacterium]|nr:cupin domain-containing protein [Kofleriaceae bacterium]
MKTRVQDEFKVLHGTPTSQVAMMTIRPGGKSNESGKNEHPWAEQWLYVVQGEGVAHSGKKTYKLAVGSVVLIEKGEPHVIENTGDTALVTLNVYSPPAYGKDGEPLFDL